MNTKSRLIGYLTSFHIQNLYSVNLDENRITDRKGHVIFKALLSVETETE
jgi:hypothetical protein